MRIFSPSVAVCVKYIVTSCLGSRLGEKEGWGGRWGGGVLITPQKNTLHNENQCLIFKNTVLGIRELENSGTSKRSRPRLSRSNHAGPAAVAAAAVAVAVGPRDSPGPRGRQRRGQAQPRPPASRAAGGRQGRSRPGCGRFPASLS
jgi:hypothetical protein